MICLSLSLAIKKTIITTHNQLYLCKFSSFSILNCKLNSSKWMIFFFLCYSNSNSNQTKKNRLAVKSIKQTKLAWLILHWHLCNYSSELTKKNSGFPYYGKQHRRQSFPFFGIDMNKEKWIKKTNPVIRSVIVVLYVCVWVEGEGRGKIRKRNTVTSCKNLVRKINS